MPSASEIVIEVLSLASDGLSHDILDLRNQLPQRFRLTAAEQQERLPSGRETLLANRWRNAAFKLRRQKLVKFLPDDKIVITAEGRHFLESVRARASVEDQLRG